MVIFTEKYKLIKYSTLPQSVFWFFECVSLGYVSSAGDAAGALMKGSFKLTSC